MKMKNGFFVVSRLHRADISERFKDETFTDAEMEAIADMMGEDFCESGAYWDSLENACQQIISER